MQAMNWYKKAAARGYHRSEYHVARMYEGGLGVTADLAQARVWYNKAAVEDVDARAWLSAHPVK